MRSVRLLAVLRQTFFIALAVGLPLGSAIAASSPKVLFSFGGDHGEYPDTDLVMDRSGNLYGTTVSGGDFDSGTVFQLTHTASGWKQQVLYSFSGTADGGQPYKGVTLDNQGNLYGTAVIGGTGGVCVEDGCGVVYQLTPSASGWTQTVIYNFQGGKDGYGPGAGLTLDRKGNLYGMTPTGGANGLGIIYQLHPLGGGTWKERILHTFTGGADGASGSAGKLLLDAQGNLFGVATTGGSHGSGVAFELSPNQNGSWKFKPIYEFKGQPDAGFPYGGLVFDQSGNLYGTTYYDGADDLGSVYELVAGAGGTWHERVLHSFAGGPDGSGSIATLVLDAHGNFYGTTSEGGDAACNCGIIFKLVPSGNGNWQESVVYLFKGPPDAAFAYDGLLGDRAGNLYGTTVHGGSGNNGALFRFKP